MNAVEPRLQGENLDWMIAVLDIAIDAIITLDAEQHIMTFNAGAESIFGYSANDVIGQPLDVLLPMRFVAVHRRHIVDFAASEDRARHMGERREIMGKRRDGSEFPAEASIARLTNRGRDGFLVVLRDVTEHRRAEFAIQELNQELQRRVDERTIELVRANRELECEIAGHVNTEAKLRASEERYRQANQELKQATRLKDEFLAHMSHELRTPLNTILGMTEVLQEQIYGELNGRQLDALSDIEEGGRHLLSLINDILDLSRIGAGKLDLTIEYVDVDQVCEAALQFVRHEAVRKRLSVSYSLDSAVTSIKADERRLKQILTNLLSNAVKFTPADGEIGLEVTQESERHAVRFSVWDTGIGMDDEELRQLFQPFIQLKGGLAREHLGTGLGLALVRQMTDLHGGSVSVESTKGKGSRFTVIIPSAEDDSVVLPTVSGHLGKQLKRVIVVEDLPQSVYQMRRYLEEFGLEVVAFEQGMSFLAQLPTLQMDLVILDLQLPDVSGWDLLRLLRKDEKTRDLPIIIVSVIDDRTRGLQAGATDYLVKPFSREQLHAALERLYGAVESVSDQAAPTADVGHLPSNPLILIAEDNVLNVATLVNYLQIKDYRLAIAHDGRDAVNQVRSLHPDLVLMDIQMPEMDGLEAMQLIRADSDPQVAKVPIIALTALAMVGDRERCLAAGASAYMSKPVNFKRLTNTVEQLLVLSTS